MSKYTTEVRYICEHYAGLDESEGYESISEIIGMSRDKIFDFNYPIFDESYKPILEEKILTHYYTREIGFETVGLWKHFLKMRMNEIMPYYNKLYISESLMPDNIFNDTDYIREGEKHDTGEGTETLDGLGAMTGTVADVIHSETEDGGADSVDRTGGESRNTEKSTSNEPKKDTWTLYSDTPQGGVAGISAAEPSVGSNAYLTNATHVIESGVGSQSTESEDVSLDRDEEQLISYGKTSETDGTNTRTYNTRNKTDNETTRETKNDGEYEEHIYGKMGKSSYAYLLKEYADKFINIDVLIIRDLGDLFMNVY